MDRQREYPGVVVKGVLHAVPVVGVHVEVEHPFRPLIEQRQDRQHRFVEIAEAGCPVRAAVVLAAAGL